MGRKAIDMTGKKVGMLTVLRRDYEKDSGSGTNAFWICKCECGKEVSLSSSTIRGKHPQKSCGCLNVTMHLTHGQTGTRLYNIWNCMKQRCQNKNSHNYKEYGARGISVCEEWKSFENFREWAVTNGYDETAKRGVCTIDRIDNNGNYEPGNCRWVDMKTQCQNRRRPANWKTAI